MDRTRQDGTQETELGPRLRKLRKECGMTLADLARGSGISASTLSKVENDKVSPTFANLLKLAETLEVPLARVIGHTEPEPPQPPRARIAVTRRDEVVFTRTPSVDIGTLCPALRNKRMAPFFDTVHPASGDLRERLVGHAGEEFVYCLDGIVEIHTEYYEPFVLHPGDSAYFDSQMAHTYCSGLPEASHMLLVLLPPEGTSEQTGAELVATLMHPELAAEGALAPEPRRRAGGR